MLIEKNILGLYNGVSQQTPLLRLDTQCELQENAIGNLVDGLTKRPPTEFIALLNSLASTSSFMHVIDRDTNERYLVVITSDANNPIEVFKLDGTKCTVRFGTLSENLTFQSDSSVKSYAVSSSSPRDAFKATTIADYTVIVNKEKTCSMSGSRVEQTPTAEVYVSKAVNSVTYNVYINESLVGSYKSNSDSDSNSIATGIYQSLVSNLTNDCLVMNLPTPNSVHVGAPNGSIQVTLEGTQVANIPYVWVGEDLQADGHYLRYYLDTPSTVNNLYSAIISNINPLYWTVLKTDRSVIVKKVAASSFSCSVSGYNYGSYSYPGGGSAWDIELIQGTDYIIIKRYDGGDFTFRVSDTWGSQASVGVKGKIQKFSNLPPRSVDGLIVEIAGDDNSQFSSYYVKYENASNQSIGVWTETVKPGLANSFDSSTLPHRLVRTNVNEFTFAPIIWQPRNIGDTDSAPEPSFIGKNISDVFFYRNRLGFLSKENVILSRAGDFFNFFPTTALDVLDDDPIDVANPSDQVANLNYAVPFNKDLLLFSDSQQFILSAGDNILSPKTVAIDLTTAYNASTSCKPVEAGADVFFVEPKDSYSLIREYYVEPSSLVDDANDVTAHVPRYIPKNVIKLTSVTQKDILLVLSSDEPNSIYVYNYLWNNNEKVQSAWSKWIFDDQIINMTTLNNNLYLLTNKDSATSLVKINLETVFTGSLTFRVHLDKQVLLTGSYNSTTNRTTWTLPYSDSSANFLVIDSSEGSLISSVQKTSNTTLTTPGNYSSAPCYIGKPYTMRYRFTKWFFKQNNIVDIQGRLQTRSMTLAFNNTGNFKVEVTPLRREKLVHNYTATIIGVSEIGKPSLVTGSQKFLVMSNSADCTIDIVNDGYLPSQFMSASFQGYYTNNNQMV